MENTSIPMFDLSDFTNDKDNFVKNLGDGYRKFGFCSITNHGIPNDMINLALESARDFFELPEKVKQSYLVEGIGGARGYTGFGIEVAKGYNHADLKEFWHVGREVDSTMHNSDLLPNLWPKEIPSFKRSLYALYQALDNLGNTILQALALYLGLDEHYFEDKVNFGNSVLRALHYPPIKNQNTLSVRASEHEDINLITLLVGSHEQGLEILTHDKKWIPVSIIPGAIVVNIGDMLQRLTNHVLRSTTHRVVNPKDSDINKSRFSIPFFLHPNSNFLIKTLSQCISKDNPNRYPEPIIAADYLRERLCEIGLLK